MHFVRGVVNLVQVCVKVQCAKVRFLERSRQIVYSITRITFAHNNKNSDSALQCFVRARIAFSNIQSLASTEQCLVNNEVVVICANVFVVNI